MAAVPSPLAHVGLAAALQLAVAREPVATRTTVAVAFASVAPDLDLVLVLVLPGGLAWHHGPTHSLLGAGLIGLAVALLGRVRGAAARVAVVSGALLHVPLDWSTGEPGSPAAYGVPWAWPFDPARAIDPTPWFGAFHIDRAGFLVHMVSPEALPVYGGELATVIVGVLLGLAIRRLRASRAGAPAPTPL